MAVSILAETSTSTLFLSTKELQLDGMCTLWRCTSTQLIDTNSLYVVTITLTLSLDLLNPKSIGFNTVSRITTVSSFKSFQSEVFLLSC